MAVLICMRLLVGCISLTDNKPNLLAITCKLVCPKCEKGRLFENSLFHFVENCSECGFPVSTHDNGDGPAFFIVCITSFLATILALWFEFRFSPPFYLHLIIWPIFITFISLAMLRPMKALMLGLNYKYNQFDE